MPKVPTVGLNASPLPGFQAPGVTAFRSAVPQQIQQSGKAMEGLGKAVTEVAFKVENDINDAVTLKSNNRLENFANKSWQEIQQLTGQEAMDAKDPTLNGYAEERKAILEGLENDVQRRQFAKFADRLQGKFGLKVEGHYIGAVAENKQQQLLSTLLTVEDSIIREPLGSETVSGFLRWQQTTQQIIAGEGIQGDLAKTVMTKRSSEFIKKIFNTYVNAGREEDALKFVEAIQLFEEHFAYDMYSARAAGLGPDKTGHYPSRDPKTGLILKSQDHPTFHKTVKGEIEAGYEFWQDPKTERWYTYPEGLVENPESRGLERKDPPSLEGMTSPEQVSLLDEETRMLLRQKTEEVSMDTWARTTANQQSSLLGALDYGEEMFTNKDWTASQLEAFESAAYNKFRLQAQAATQNRVAAMSSAQSEFETTGEITLETEDNLRKSGKWFDYLKWQQNILSGQSRNGSKGGGSLSTNEGLEWLAMYGDNPQNDERVARSITGPEDLRNLFNKVVEEGVSQQKASTYVQTISKLAFPGGGDELLEQIGIKDKEDVSSRIEAFWGEQFDSLKEEANFGALASEQTNSQLKRNATINLLLGREESFVVDVKDNIRSVSSEYPNKTRDEVVDLAINKTWSQSSVTYTEDGVSKRGNFLLMSNARQQAVMMLKNPLAAVRSLEEMANENRKPADPDSPYSKQKILDAAYSRWRNQEDQKAIEAKDFDRRKTLRALEVVNLVPSGLRSDESIGLSVPLPSSLAPNANPSDLELLELGFQIQEEDRFAGYARQEDLSTSLHASIYRDTLNLDWVDPKRKVYSKTQVPRVMSLRAALRKEKVDYPRKTRSMGVGGLSWRVLKQRYDSDEMRNYWIAVKGLTESRYDEVIRENKVLGTRMQPAGWPGSTKYKWYVSEDFASQELKKLEESMSKKSTKEP